MSRSFVRKIIYFAIIAILLVPLALLSRPSSGGTAGKQDPGGVLAQYREKHKLSQANLGEIDPASETMKLACLGMRGVAANILWTKANEYKKTENWEKLSATLEQITKLQPNFLTVWEFQGWNLAYNVSVEFDNYNDRYYWVTRGIKFLEEGNRYNENKPRLLWYLGWVVAQKIGRADEHKEFRALFKDDDDFHPPDRPRDERDNWLVGRQWFLKAQDAVDNKGEEPRGGPLIFHSTPPMALMNYADALGEEGVHGEIARQAWNKAGKAWRDYGARELSTSFNLRIRLNDEERFREQAKEIVARLDAIVPGLRDKMQEERRAQLTDVQKKAMEVPAASRTAEQYQIASDAENMLKISNLALAARIEKELPGKGTEAGRLARLADRYEEQARIISQQRQTVNFVYWRTRAEMEQTDDALEARALIDQGDMALANADFVKAKERYDAGMVKWRAVLDRYPEMVDEVTTGEDLMEAIGNYRKLLGELDEEFPSDFILMDVIEKNDREGQFKDIVKPKTPEGEKPEPPESEGMPPEPE